MKFKDLKGEIFIALCLLGGYVFFWIMYAKSLNDANETWYKKEYLDKSITGVLTSINEFDNDPFQIILSIKNQGDDFNIEYGVTCVDKEFRDFVAVGDSVFKVGGVRTMQFCKLLGNCKAYELNFCGAPK